MILGPITHAGSQWRKLCARCGLDPQQATADEVAAQLNRPTDQAALVYHDLVRACAAAEAHLIEDPAQPAHAEHRSAVLDQLTAALTAALQQGD